MSNQDDTKKSKEEEQAQQGRMYLQFEAAKRLYAAHRLLVNAPPLNGEKIVNFLNQTLMEFKAAGGDAKTGTDGFGERGPVLALENGDVISYEAGRMLAQDYISRGIFR